MKNILFILATLLFLSSCSEEKTSTVDPAIEITHSKMSSENGLIKNVAQIEVEGMMCEVACCTKVKSELAELECVSNVEIDFNPDNPVDIAKVEFNPDQCDEKAMIEKIQKIGDGMYKVRSVEILTYQ